VIQSQTLYLWIISILTVDYYSLLPWLVSFIAVDIVISVRYKDVYRQIRDGVEKTDVNKDLIWWSQTHGTGMSMTTTTFEVQ